MCPTSTLLQYFLLLLLSRTIVTIALSEHGLELNLESRRKKRVNEITELGYRVLRRKKMSFLSLSLLLYYNICTVFSQMFDKNSVCIHEKYILCRPLQFHCRQELGVYDGIEISGYFDDIL